MFIGRFIKKKNLYIFAFLNPVVTENMEILQWQSSLAKDFKLKSPQGQQGVQNQRSRGTLVLTKGDSCHLFLVRNLDVSVLYPDVYILTTNLKILKNTVQGAMQHTYVN